MPETPGGPGGNALPDGDTIGTTPALIVKDTLHVPVVINCFSRLSFRLEDTAEETRAMDDVAAGPKGCVSRESRGAEVNLRTWMQAGPSAGAPVGMARSLREGRSPP